MNSKPIDQALDADLRLSLPALRRAARRARELAIQTGTDLIVSHNGVLQRITPTQALPTNQVQEEPATYGTKQL